MKKIFKILGATLVTLLILLVVLIIVSFVSLPGDFKVFNVLTGSMEPAIKAGSMVVVSKEDSYKINDIVTFGGDKSTPPTTHRIVEMKLESGESVFITKGDANQSQDLTPIRQNVIIGKVIFTIPFIGKIVGFAKTPIGFGVLVLVPSIIFVYEEIKKIGREISKLKKGKDLTDNPNKTEETIQ